MMQVNFLIKFINTSPLLACYITYIYSEKVMGQLHGGLTIMA